MAETVVFLVVLALVGYAVQRNHVVKRSRDPGLAGSSTANDRDAERVHAELDAVGAHAPQYRVRHAHAGGPSARQIGMAGGRR
ncbi:MAG TPA: hypothetical protein VH352_16845 [Pseudonocardiaceae bacterium]|jgi:hypothetical protein|nr:hypothetical protein [Pseudonocardiaceae bacterium]